MGSTGAIVIGRVAEFDYGGTQAVRGARRGYRVILACRNPATIMTDL